MADKNCKEKARRLPGLPNRNYASFRKYILVR